LLAALLAAIAVGGCVGGSGGGNAMKESTGPCAGKTPLEAAQQFEAAARRAGASARIVALATHPPASVRSSPGYPRLAASLYAVTQPVPERAGAAANCAEELASSEEGRASSTRAK
jgi:hypothetical protein